MIEKLLYYFEGLDRSIIELNKCISDEGFEFVIYDLTKFIKTFRGLIPIVQGQGYDEIIPALGISYKDNFGLERLRYINYQEIVDDKYIVLLNYKNLVKDFTELIDVADNLVKELMKKMKLFKTGHIKLISSFLFTNDEGLIPVSYSSPLKEINYTKYSLSDTDLKLKIFLEIFKDKFTVPPYLNLAFNSFLEYYNIENENLKFVLLMIVLESIFNVTPDQITHTISRHAAILLTIRNNAENKEALFKKKYKEVKDLYSIRSTIVHSKIKYDKPSKEYFQNPITKIAELEKIVREVLQKLIWLHDFESNRPTDKKELFDYLNAKGFPG